MVARDNRGTRAAAWSMGAFRSFALLLAAGLIPVAALSMPHGPPLPLLPIVSLLAIAGSAAAATMAWWTRASRTGPAVTAWDVSGAFAFIGIAAGIMSGPDQVLMLFGFGPLKNG